MGIDTKGMLDIGSIELCPFKVSELVSKTVRAMIVNHPLVQKHKELGYAVPWFQANREAKENGQDTPVFRFATTTIDDLFHVLRSEFVYDSESRSLSINFDCHCDYQNIVEGRKLIMSLGNWGHSVEIMETILKAIAEHYNVTAYQIDNDCTDEWRVVHQKVELPSDPAPSADVTVKVARVSTKRSKKGTTTIGFNVETKRKKK